MPKKILYTLISLSTFLLYSATFAGPWDPTELEKFGTILDAPSTADPLPQPHSACRVWATFGPQSPALFEWLVNEMKVDKKKLEEKILSLAEDHFNNCPQDELNRILSFTTKK